MATRPQQGGNQETFGKPRRLISKRIWPSSKLDEQHEDRATRVCLQEADHSQHGSKSESQWKRQFASDIRALEKITTLAAFHDNLEIPIQWVGYNLQPILLSLRTVKSYCPIGMERLRPFNFSLRPSNPNGAEWRQPLQHSIRLANPNRMEGLQPLQLSLRPSNPNGLERLQPLQPSLRPCKWQVTTLKSYWLGRITTLSACWLYTKLLPNTEEGSSRSGKKDILLIQHCMGCTRPKRADETLFHRPAH